MSSSCWAWIRCRRTRIRRRHRTRTARRWSWIGRSPPTDPVLVLVGHGRHTGGMRRLIPLLLLLTACASDPPPGAQERRAKLDEEFTLARGESIGLAGTPYVVVFDQVLEDSRCAQGMTCIWEGNARVGLH